jgi:hypothetical protein
MRWVRHRSDRCRGVAHRHLQGCKDIYNLAGTVTTGGVRALSCDILLRQLTGLQDRQFGETFGVVEESGYAVSRLIELGAVPVGKTKVRMSSSTC